MSNELVRTALKRRMFELEKELKKASEYCVFSFPGNTLTLEEIEDIEQELKRIDAKLYKTRTD